jgi:hypothetical protein
MANNQIISVGIDRNWNVNFGNLCDGDTVTLRVCHNDNTGTHTGTVNICGCDAFTVLPPTFTLGPCACTDLTFTLNGNGYPGSGSCYIEIKFNNKISSINLNWNEVYCDIKEVSWTFGDLNSSIIIENRTFKADCDITDNYVFAQAVYLQRRLLFNQPLVAGDELFLSQWLFAQIVDWTYQNYPVAGWKTRICLQPAGEGEDPSVDGVYQMEWYGQQPSEENSQDTPYVFATVSNNGGQVLYYVQFNLPEDSINPPSNFPLANHRTLLANSIRNGIELNNQSENSIYRNLKYMSWAFVVYRSVGSVYQDDIFSIRGKFPFEKESPNASAVQLFVLNVALATPLNQPTPYLSTARLTKVRVDFQFNDNNTTGTPPTDMWVYLIRNDSQNNQLDYYENYEYDQADLTNLIPGTLITPVTVPTNITSNEFFAEFDVAQVRNDLTGVENISNNYRFIFVVTSALDRQSRSWVTEPIQLINYDDQDLTLTGIEAKFRTVEQEYAGTIGTLTGTCVNMNLETALQANLPLSDTEVQAKTGNLIQTAFEAYKGARLSIYQESPLTGSQLLNTQYFQAQGQLICDKVTDNGLEPIINRTQGSSIDLTFPFTIPDNVYRKIGREGLFQSDVTEPTAWSTLSLASLSCVQNRTSEQCDVLFALPAIATIINPQYLVYVPDTNEVWVSGEDANPGDGAIYAIDLNNNLAVSQIITIGLDYPVGMLYVPGVGVMASFPNSGAIRFYNPTTRTAITTITVGLGATGMLYLPQYNQVWIACNVSNEVYRINPLTQTFIGSPLNIPGSGVIELTYVDSLDEVWVACQSSNDVQRIDRNSFALVGSPIGTTSMNPKQILYSQAGNVWVTSDDNIDVISTTTFSLIHSILNVGQLGYGLTINAGIIYASDAGADLIRLYDEALFLPLSTYATGDSPRNILFAPNVLLVSNKTTDDVTPFLLDCNDSLPPFTMVNRNIKLNWDLEFRFFDNTEIYTISQELNRPSPSRIADFVNDFVDIIIEEEPNDGTPTPIPIDNLCPTTGQVIVTANLVNPQRVMSVGIELQPVRGGVYTSESSASPISIPSDSEAIYDLTPAYGVTSSVSFRIDTPSLNLTGDYEIVLHFITQ